MLRLFSVTLVTAIVMTGCNQDKTIQAAKNSPPVEPPDITSKDFGNYIVHFNAITSDQLPPEVARTYNITRSKNRALLNISIIRKTDDSTGTSVSGEVEVSANNLTGQVKNLLLKKIQEGNAIYYIGDVSVMNAETLVFTVSIRPEGETNRYSLRFTRQFFTD